MGRVSRHVEGEPGVTANGIRKGVKAKRDTVTLALDRLLSEGYIERRKEGQSYRHFSLQPFDEDTVPHPFPNRSPGTVQPTVPLFPSPLREGHGAREHHRSDDRSPELSDRIRKDLKAVALIEDDDLRERAWANLTASRGE